MIDTIRYESVVRPDLAKGAVRRRDFPGFHEDYLALHCLIRANRPERFFEIGTSTGRGTRVICKAMSRRRLWPDTRSRVFSLDVPPGTDAALLYPEGEDGHPVKAGGKNPYPYTQLFGDSKSFDASPYFPIDGWFIDGKHNYDYARSDTLLALTSDPRLIIWHDMQIDEVRSGVTDAMRGARGYVVNTIEGTRLGVALRSE
ncbi:MAG TPA: class I SAM-dependent methyltransferase [Actinomycetota bacterium]|nr:class I SAM-dependent methyltransferase [Actinomycetota bacterium]